MTVFGLVLSLVLFPKTHLFSTHFRDVSSLETRPSLSPSDPSPDHDIQNIILITYDALRSDHLSFFGHPRLTSPFLDFLAARSAAFSNVTAAYPQTSQSFASLLTGTYPWKHGIWQFKTVLPDRVVTLAEELKGHGYNTYAAVTNGNIAPVFNYNQGFDTYVPLGGSDPVHITDSALKMVDEGLEEPYLFWVHYLDPHAPYQPPESYSAMFEEDPTYLGDLNPENYRRNLEGSTPTAEKVAEALADYDGEIRYQDEQFERLFNALQNGGHLDRALVLFTSDHGEFFGHHGYYFNHGPSPYRELQVPMFWYCPPLIAPKISSQPVELIDIVPTILSLLDLEAGQIDMDGVDLSPYLTGQDAPPEFPRRYALGTAYVTDQKGYPQFFILRSDRWDLIVNKLDHLKLIDSPRKLLEYPYDLFKFRGQGIELYDRNEDPGERTNLRSRKSEITNTMLNALGERLFWHARQGVEGQSPVSQKDLDPETYKKLKSLGYIK